MDQWFEVDLRKTFFGPPRGIQGSGDLPDLVRPNPDAATGLDWFNSCQYQIAPGFAIC